MTVKNHNHNSYQKMQVPFLLFGQNVSLPGIEYEIFSCPVAV